jgi:DinB superfamily
MNHIGFLFWHLVRDEDWILPWISKVEPVWITDGWSQRSGLTALEQGTGFDPQRAAQVEVSRVDLIGYADRVWQRSDELLGELAEEDLDRDLPSGPNLPVYNVGSLLTTGCLNHSWSHLGEIRCIKGLKGWRYRE